MKDCLPPNALKQKLPRFLQKCTQSFASDRRYRNDPRYLRVWLQLVISKPVSLFFFFFGNWGLLGFRLDYHVDKSDFDHGLFSFFSNFVFSAVVWFLSKMDQQKRK
jgi:hypothetical protein